MTSRYLLLIWLIGCSFAVAESPPLDGKNRFRELDLPLKMEYIDDRSLAELRESVLQDEPVRVNEYTKAYANYRKRAILSLINHGEKGLAVLEAILSSDSKPEVKADILKALGRTPESTFCPGGTHVSESGDMALVYGLYAKQWRAGDLDGMTEYLAPNIADKFRDRSREFMATNDAKNWFERFMVALSPQPYLVKAECVSEDGKGGYLIIAEKCYADAAPGRCKPRRQIGFRQFDGTWKVVDTGVLDFLNGKHKSSDSKPEVKADLLKAPRRTPERRVILFVKAKWPRLREGKLTEFGCGKMTATSKVYYVTGYAIMALGVVMAVI